MKNEIERSVQKELLKLYTFDLPESLIRHEAEKQRNQIQAALKEQNHSDEEIKKVAEEVEKVAKERADQMLRTHYLLFKVADEEKFEITNDEILKELMMMSMRPDGSFDHETLQHPEKYADAIRSKLRLFKAIDFVAKRVNKV